MVTYSKLHTEDLHTVGATVKNFVAPDLCILDANSCVFRARILLAFLFVTLEVLVLHVNVGTAITYLNLISPPPPPSPSLPIFFRRLDAFLIAAIRYSSPQYYTILPSTRKLVTDL
jgi:hypothetical protein